MKELYLTIAVSGLLLASLACHTASADVLNMGGTRDPATGQWTGLASLELVPVGDSGNAADTTEQWSDPGSTYGSVSYTYGVGKYEVTCAQYCEFLNAVAKTDTYLTYGPLMASGWASCGIAQSGSPSSYVYTVTKNPNFPVNFVSWGDAARFCNWLANGQPSGPQGPGTTETGSYTLDGANTARDLLPIVRNASATYVIPSEDEWFKAAYYKGGGVDTGYWIYPTRSDDLPSNLLSSSGTNNANFSAGIPGNTYTDPTNYLTTAGYFAGSQGPHGTFDQGGNVFEWTEAKYSGSYRHLRGGGFMHADNGGMWLMANNFSHNIPTYSQPYVGFRVALVPEPATLSLLALGGLLLARRRRA
jgi:formylglycine-generating enzyme